MEIMRSPNLTMAAPGLLFSWVLPAFFAAKLRNLRGVSTEGVVYSARIAMFKILVN